VSSFLACWGTRYPHFLTSLEPLSSLSTLPSLSHDQAGSAATRLKHADFVINCGLALHMQKNLLSS
jgi:hypothetical protein